MASFNTNDFTNSPPDWTALGVEPKESVKATGFFAGYKPPAAYFNWFWTKTSNCFREIQEKIRGIWDFIRNTEIVIKEDLGNVHDETTLNTMFDRGQNSDKRTYLFQFRVYDSLAELFNVPDGTEAELTVRYTDIKYIVYIPYYNRTFFYIRHGAQIPYAWEEQIVNPEKIPDKSISPTKLTDLNFLVYAQAELNQNIVFEYGDGTYEVGLETPTKGDLIGVYIPHGQGTVQTSNYEDYWRIHPSGYKVRNLYINDSPEQVQIYNGDIEITNVDWVYFTYISQKLSQKYLQGA